jgi:hypothetical protein
MPRLQAKSFTNPDDAQTTPNVRFDTVNLDETTVGYCHFEPGWRWTKEFGSAWAGIVPDPASRLLDLDGRRP